MEIENKQLKDKNMRMENELHQIGNNYKRIVGLLGKIPTLQDSERGIFESERKIKEITQKMKDFVDVPIIENIDIPTKDNSAIEENTEIANLKNQLVKKSEEIQDYRVLLSQVMRALQDLAEDEEKKSSQSFNDAQKQFRQCKSSMSISK